MRPNNLSSYLTKLGSIITALADLINTFTLAPYVSIYYLSGSIFYALGSNISNLVPASFLLNTFINPL
ncbi:MAG: hypothetical protein BWX91_00159 [Spirochaetes bacterium ADurb.Bin133]|nr:MAG: hypothetical protein BWX91_00159 [Spirochaetes bacterium ADurb.Bin133]